MSTIQVDIERSRRENARLTPIRSNVDDVISRLTSIQSAIDSRVLDQRDLQRRIMNVRNSIGFVERDLQNVQICIRDILNRYEQTDRDLSARIPSSGIMSSFDT